MGPGRKRVNRDADNRSAVDRASPWLSNNALKRFQQPLVDYLLCGLEENDKWVQIMAAQMLGNLGDPRATDHLKPLLASRDRDLRTVAAQSIAMIYSPRAVLPSMQADPCDTCMIRLIADEAIQKLKTAK
jgi:HEAT repeat protein